MEIEIFTQCIISAGFINGFLNVSDCHNIFALMMKSCHELKEQKNMIYSFTLTDESVDKANYLRILCNQIANIVCRTDTVSRSKTISLAYYCHFLSRLYIHIM